MPKISKRKKKETKTKDKLRERLRERCCMVGGLYWNIFTPANEWAYFSIRFSSWSVICAKHIHYSRFQTCNDN